MILQEPMCQQEMMPKFQTRFQRGNQTMKLRAIRHAANPVRVISNAARTAKRIPPLCVVRAVNAESAAVGAAAGKTPGRSVILEEGVLSAGTMRVGAVGLHHGAATMAMETVMAAGVTTGAISRAPVRLAHRLHHGVAAEAIRRVIATHRGTSTGAE